MAANSLDREPKATSRMRGTYSNGPVKKLDLRNDPIKLWDKRVCQCIDVDQRSKEIAFTNRMLLAFCVQQA